MKSFNRDKKKEYLKVKLVEILRKEADHPVLQFVTVSELIIDRKIQKIEVIFSCFGTDPNLALQHLKRLAPRLRSRLFTAAEMKNIPPLTFRYNTGADHADKMERIFARLHEHEGTTGKDKPNSGE